MKPGLGMLEKIIDEAQGNVPASLVIKNIAVFNLITGETVRGDIAVCDDRIVGVGETYDGEREIDGDVCLSAAVVAAYYDKSGFQKVFHWSASADNVAGQGAIHFHIKFHTGVRS